LGLPEPIALPVSFNDMTAARFSLSRISLKTSNDFPAAFPAKPIKKGYTKMRNPL
jgi:hypothetical protein